MFSSILGFSRSEKGDLSLRCMFKSYCAFTWEYVGKSTSLQLSLVLYSAYRPILPLLWFLPVLNPSQWFPVISILYPFLKLYSNSTPASLPWHSSGNFVVCESSFEFNQKDLQFQPLQIPGIHHSLSYDECPPEVVSDNVKCQKWCFWDWFWIQGCYFSVRQRTLNLALIYHHFSFKSLFVCLLATSYFRVGSLMWL